jgi:hypothetical protein
VLPTRPVGPAGGDAGLYVDAMKWAFDAARALLADEAGDRLPVTALYEHVL